MTALFHSTKAKQERRKRQTQSDNMITHAAISEFISNQDTLLPKKRPSSSSKRQKRVRFYETVIVHRVLRINDYSKAEKKSCFRTKKDAKLIEILQGKPIKHIRGLEKLTNFGSERDVSTKSCINSILDEQDRQWSEGINDVNRVADACRQISAKSTILALLLADYDEREALKAYKKMNTDKKRSPEEYPSSPRSITKRAKSSPRRNSPKKKKRKTDVLRQRLTTEMTKRSSEHHADEPTELRLSALFPDIDFKNF
jgi:hypothetical protein